jgi:hypothetical protein
VSGSDSATEGPFRGVLDGPALLTGGGFGPEASVVAVLVSVGATVYLVRPAARRGNLRPAGAQPRDRIDDNPPTPGVDPTRGG